MKMHYYFICHNRNLEAVIMLLNAGIDPNSADVCGDACLTKAVLGGCSKETILALIDHGANVNAKNRKGKIILMAACYKENAVAINVLLNTGAKPEIVDDEGYTSLHWACQAGNSKETIQALIDHGADVNATNKKARTALMEACCFGNMNATNVLLNAGAKPEIVDDKGNTSLHWTCISESSKEKTQALIDHGADVNAKNRKGQTVLMSACGKENAVAINLLLNAGAKPDIVDDGGFTSLHAACQAGNSKETLQALIDHGADVNAANRKGHTVLMSACRKENAVAINALLKAGAKPEIVDDGGFTSLHKACHAGNSKETIQALIDHGVDENAANKRARTALMIACELGNVNAINVLLNAGAKPDIVDDDGNTILHAACSSDNSKETIQALIDLGADVNATNKWAHTILMYDCELGNENAINVLLNAGAKPDIVDDEGYTSLHWACSSDNSKETIQAIIDHGANTNAKNRKGQTVLMCACRKENAVAINVLLKAGAKPEFVDDEGFTSLHAACQAGNSKETIQALTDHGVDVNATNKWARTALMEACRFGNMNAINVLMKARAKPDIVDDEGFTNLHWACISESSKETIQAIIDLGVDVNATNKRGSTALMIACYFRNMNAINVLLNAGADPNIPDDLSDTCVHTAVLRDCSKEILQALVHHGADVNAKTKGSATALMIACEKGFEDSIIVLMNAGTDPNIVSVDGFSCLYCAVDGGCSEEIMLALVKKGANVNAKTTDGLSALQYACSAGNTHAINVLLSAGAFPNVADHNGDTCLHHAVLGDCNKEFLQEIINHGAGVNATNKWHETALLTACSERNVHATNVFLNAGADPNIADDSSNTCVHNSVLEGCSKEVLQTLVHHGADVNAKNKWDETALMIACRKGNEDSTIVLMNAGTDPNITSVDGFTCLYFAVDGGCSKEIMLALVKKGANVNGDLALQKACFMGNANAINVLLNAGAIPNIINHTGNTCLHYAVLGDCSKESLQEIIDCGAHVNATNEWHETALLIDCSKRKVFATNVLLNAGTDPNIADDLGNTCVHNAVLKGYSKEVLQALVHHSADVNATNKKNQTILMTAYLTSNADAVNVLLNAGADPNIANAQEVNVCLHVVAMIVFCLGICFIYMYL